MARTKNAKRAKVEGESSASARLVASSHYMEGWLPSLRALNNYVEKFKSMVIVPPSDKEDEEVMPLIEFDLGSQHYRYKDSHMDARAKIDDSVLRQMEKYPDAQEPQVQGQPQDPEVQAQSQESPPPPPHSPTMRDLMDELRRIRLYIDGQFAEMRQHQDRQTEAINHQEKVIDLLYTNLGIPNPKGIILRREN
ncbi:hypothetical protein HN51_011713 [Arachis hypogaea]